MSMVQDDLGHSLAAASSTTLQLVTFFAGGQRCAMEARHVGALRPLTDEDNEKYPAIESLLGLPEQNKACSCRQLLTIRLAESDVELSAATPVQLRELAFDVIYPLPDLVAARTRLRGFCALLMEADELTLVFDLRNLELGSPWKQG